MALHPRRALSVEQRHLPSEDATPRIAHPDRLAQTHCVKETD